MLQGGEGWKLEPDPDDNDRQTLLFVYPPTSGYGLSYGNDYGGRADADYIKPRIKLEFGARGDPDPSEILPLSPYIAEEFPDLMPSAQVKVPTLAVERTFFEKATILHALAHNAVCAQPCRAIITTPSCWLERALLRAQQPTQRFLHRWSGIKA